MISEAFNEGWVENNGEQPVDDSVFVDVVWDDGSKDFNYCAEEWRWKRLKDCNSIVRWRLHNPQKDVFVEVSASQVPEHPLHKQGHYENVKCSSSQTSPPVFVPEGEGYHKGLHDHTEQSKVVQAFNRMTGHNITDDNLNTLKVLVELFGK